MGAEYIASSENIHGMVVCKGILFFKWRRAVFLDVLFCEYSMDKIKHQMENGRIFETISSRRDALGCH